MIQMNHCYYSGLYRYSLSLYEKHDQMITGSLSVHLVALCVVHHQMEALNPNVSWVCEMFHPLIRLLQYCVSHMT